MFRRSYKFRLYPNKDQVASLERSLDLCRELYNAAIQERRDAWKINRVRISCFDQIRQLKDVRKERPEFQSMLFSIPAQTLRQVDKAFGSFFRRVNSGKSPGYPRFKGATSFNSLFCPSAGFKFVRGKLHLAKIGLLKIKQHREIVGTVKQITVKREGLKWYAILSCDGIEPHPLPTTGKAVGLDVGIESFATTSTGERIKNWRHYESSAKELRVAQRRVSRRKKGSNRRRKAVAVVRNVHQRIANQRRDFQHKLSTRLITANDLIAVEKLNIAGLAKGRLAKQILDASWSSFLEMLRYKAEWAGRKLIEVDPRWTSQDCSACGERVKKSLSVRMHHCSCGPSLHRDHNAALNILSRGLRDQDLTWAAMPCVS